MCWRGGICVGVFVLGRGYLHERGGICVGEGVFVWKTGYLCGRGYLCRRGGVWVGEGEFLEYNFYSRVIKLPQNLEIKSSSETNQNFVGRLAYCSEWRHYCLFLQFSHRIVLDHRIEQILSLSLTQSPPEGLTLF